MKWYKHDSDAHADAKLKRIILKYGMEGYGIYWYCLELIARNVTANRVTFELEEDAELIAADTNLHIERVEEMMTYMVNLGLFEESEGRITCLKMAHRLDQSMTSHPGMRKLIEEIRKNHDPVMTNHDPIMTKSDLIKSDKIRLDKNRIDKNREEITSTSKKVDQTPHQKVVDLYHEILPNLPGVRVLTAKRKTAIKQRHNTIMEKDLDNWRGFFQAVSRSRFLMGELPGKDWQASFDFLVTEKAAVGVLEGKYQ